MVPSVTKQKSSPKTDSRATKSGEISGVSPQARWGEGFTHVDPPTCVSVRAGFSGRLPPGGGSRGLHPSLPPGQRERVSVPAVHTPKFLGSDWSGLGLGLLPEPITMARGACRAVIDRPGMALCPPPGVEDGEWSHILITQSWVKNGDGWLSKDF